MSSAVNQENDTASISSEVITKTNTSGPYSFLKLTLNEEPKELNPETGHWYSGQTFAINDPLVVKYGEYNDTIEILNYSLYDLDDVIVYFNMHHDVDKYEIFRLKIKALHHYVINTGVYDKNNETKFTIEVDDPRYKKLQSMDICWKIKIPRVASYGSSKIQSPEDVRNIIAILTNIAYALSSPEFETCLRNFEDIYGQKWRMFPEFHDYSTTPTNLPDNIALVDTKTDEGIAKVLKSFGVKNDVYGGLPRNNTFSFGVVPNSKARGKGVTFFYGYDGLDKLYNGFSIIVREQYIKTKKGYTTTFTIMHEMGHLLGYQHFTAMCYGIASDKGSRFIETIMNLLMEDLPYWDILPDTGKTRCGFNYLEKYFYEHPDLVKKFYDRLSAEKDARNAQYNKIKSSWSNTGIWFIDGSRNQSLVNSLHPADKDTYTLTIEDGKRWDSEFYKVT